MDLRREQAGDHRPDRQPGRHQDAGRPGKSGVKIIAAGDEVPITKYANQLVDNLAKEPGYPADFAAAYDTNIVVQGGQRQGRRRQDRARRG